MAYVLALDCELTGPMMIKHAIVNLGGVLLDAKTGKTVDCIDLLINVPEDRGWDKDTELNFWKDPDMPHLGEMMALIKREEGQDYQEAVGDLVKFLRKCENFTKGNMVIITDHATDVGWVNLYLSMCGFQPLHIIFGKLEHTITTSSYHHGSSHTTHTGAKRFESERRTKFSGSEAAMQYFRIPFRATTKYTHKALQDAENIAQTHLIILNAIECLNTMSCYAQHQ